VFNGTTAFSLSNFVLAAIWILVVRAEYHAIESGMIQSFGGSDSKLDNILAVRIYFLDSSMWTILGYRDFSVKLLLCNIPLIGLTHKVSAIVFNMYLLLGTYCCRFVGGYRDPFWRTCCRAKLRED
jgi:hypothetical protein